MSNDIKVDTGNGLSMGLVWFNVVWCGANIEFEKSATQTMLGEANRNTQLETNSVGMEEGQRTAQRVRAFFDCNRLLMENALGCIFVDMKHKTTI